METYTTMASLKELHADTLNQYYADLLFKLSEVLQTGNKKDSVSDEGTPTGKPSPVNQTELNEILDMHKTLSIDLFDTSIQSYNDLIKQRDQEVHMQKAIVTDVQAKKRAEDKILQDSMQVIEVENLELKRQIATRSNDLYHSAHELTEKEKELEKMEEEYQKQIERQ